MKVGSTIGGNHLKYARRWQYVLVNSKATTQVKTNRPPVVSCLQIVYTTVCWEINQLIITCQPLKKRHTSEVFLSSSPIVLCIPGQVNVISCFDTAVRGAEAGALLTSCYCSITHHHHHRPCLIFRAPVGLCVFHRVFRGSCTAAER